MFTSKMFIEHCRQWIFGIWETKLFRLLLVNLDGRRMKFSWDTKPTFSSGLESSIIAAEKFDELCVLWSANKNSKVQFQGKHIHKLSFPSKCRFESTPRICKCKRVHFFFAHKQCVVRFHFNLSFCRYFVWILHEQSDPMGIGIGMLNVLWAKSIALQGIGECILS